jgi:predicted small lipoprotein YifL
LKFKTIVGAASLALLLIVAACGQKGPLTLPTEPAAQNRATLPQVLSPAVPSAAPSTATSATPASSPASAPKR